jgi:hypothetical protein
MKKPNDMEEYVPLLLQDIRVQNELKSAFPEKYEAAISELLKKKYEGIGGEAHDTISELILNESTDVEDLEGQGYAGEFPIIIYQFGPLFWIYAQEFDNVGYFDTAEDALSHAEEEWSSYM